MHVCFVFFIKVYCSAHVPQAYTSLTSTIMFATKFTALLFALVSSVSASAIWDPTILTPNAQSVWVRGQTTEVTW